MSTVDDLLNAEPLVSVLNTAKTFQDINEARKWIPRIIVALADLKCAPGGAGTFKSLVKRISDTWKGKGSGAFREEIEDLVSYEETKRRNERLHQATDDAPNLNTNKNGIALASLDNLVKVLLHNKYIHFRHDTFFDQSLFRFVGDALWHQGLPKSQFEMLYPNKDPEMWYLVKGHLPEIKLYLNQFFPEERRWFELEDAIRIVAERNQINIYRNWFDYGLPDWDGIDRMDVLHRYAGIKNKEWSMVVAHSIFLGMTARCYEPGYDYRGVVILEGKQEIGKSWLCRILAFHSYCYTQFMFNKHLEGYEISRQLKGIAVVEMPDMGGISTKDQNFVKAFLTNTHDRNRKMHQDTVEHQDRIGIIIVTTNISGRYLTDTTGNSRFLTAFCDTNKIDVESIQKELPQLFAQSKYLWEIGIEPRLTENEKLLRDKMVKPREVISDYYYYMLEIIKLHRNEFKFDENENWDDGATQEEILNWCQGTEWWASKPKHRHWAEIAVVLTNHFQLVSSQKRIPAIRKRIDSQEVTGRKWRYRGNLIWDVFLDSLED